MLTRICLLQTAACELLLQHRVELKYKGKKVETILNRLHVAEPTPRDNKQRPAFIPEAAIRY
jgi:nucleolar GTP-binding protein